MIDVPKVYRCVSWLMCCNKMQHWSECMRAVAGEVSELAEDDETRVMVRQLAAARMADLKEAEDE